MKIAPFLTVLMLSSNFTLAQELHLVKDLVPGMEGLKIEDKLVVNGLLFFTTKNANGQTVNLWRSDGTEQGTYQLLDNLPLWLDPYLVRGNMLGSFNGICYFSAFDTLHGVELWQSDGTPGGTFMVADLVEGTLSSDPHAVIQLGNEFIFFGRSKVDTELKRSIYKSDGTPGGTSFVALTPGCFGFGDSRIWNKTVVNGTVYFHYYTETCLWKTDGTASGTSSFSTINPATMVPSDSLVFFKDAYLGRTNGTTSGTYFLSSVPYPDKIVSFGNSVIFSTIGGYQLWISDGSEQGSKLIREFMGSLVTTQPSYLTPFKGKIYLSTGEKYTDTVIIQTVGAGRELWVTDGTESGTTLVKDILPGTQDGYPQNLTVVGNHLYFTAKVSSSSWGIYRTDGAGVGTFLVYAFQPGEYVLFGQPEDFVAVGDELLFTMDDGEHGREFYKLNIPVTTADFSYDVNDLTATFLNASQNSTSWQWSFGDQSGSSSQNPIYTYDIPGIYEVCLIATSSFGTADTICKDITVGSAPVANFNFQVDNLQVAFTDASSNHPVSWQWDFGDGATSEEQHPAHEYSNSPGNYEVCLTAANALGTSTFCQDIMTISGINDWKERQRLNVYPNPCSENCYLKIPHGELTISELMLYNNIGKAIPVTIGRGSEHLEIRKENLSKGIYFFMLIQNGKIIGRGKLIIE